MVAPRSSSSSSPTSRRELWLMGCIHSAFIARSEWLQVRSWKNISVALFILIYHHHFHVPCEQLLRYDRFRDGFESTGGLRDESEPVSELTYSMSLLTTLCVAIIQRRWFLSYLVLQENVSSPWYHWGISIRHVQFFKIFNKLLAES